MKLRGRYDVKICEAGPPLSPDDIDGCEGQLQLRFPQDYRALLLRTNGGRPEPAGMVYKGASLTLEYLFSVHSPLPQRDLIATTELLRQRHGLPPDYLPVARVAGDANFVLLECGPAAAGQLHYWLMAELGFLRGEGLGESNVWPLSYSIGDIPAKLGPLRNREDMDGLFSRLFWVAGYAATGVRVARQLVSAGYDVNFVLPHCRHPVFVALDFHAFGMVQTLVELGTRADHKDEDGSTLLARLQHASEWWHDRLADPSASKSVKTTAKRQIHAIEASLEALRNPAA